MKKYIVIVCLLVGQLVAAQTTVNQFQYVIVPARFKLQMQDDEYRLNTLTKLLLEKYGFKVYFSNDVLPPELKGSRCNKLYADVVSSGNLILTKVEVTLKDCKNTLVYKSDIGKSKKNDLNAAYNEALRQAFTSFETLHYQYTPAENTEKTVLTNDQTTSVKEPLEDQVDLLYAETVSNGYKLLDANQKVVMKLFKTSNPMMFSAEKKKTKGVLIAKDNQWFFEYYKEDQLISEKVNVKFE